MQSEIYWLIGFLTFITFLIIICIIEDYLPNRSSNKQEMELERLKMNEAIVKLKSINDYLTGKLNEFMKRVALTSDFWEFIHKDIVRVSKQRYLDGHYADAVESAFKEINQRVKQMVKGQTGKEYDGSSLMFKAFPVENPIIILADLSTKSGQDTQNGLMHLFVGGILAGRNPKAHENIIIDESNAINFIFLANILMTELDNAKFAK